MEIHIPFDSSEKSIRLVKFASLYFDQVRIACIEYSDNNSFSHDNRIELYDVNLIQLFKPLLHNNVVKIDIHTFDFNNKLFNALEPVFEKIMINADWDEAINILLSQIAEENNYYRKILKYIEDHYYKDTYFEEDDKKFTFITFYLYHQAETLNQILFKKKNCISNSSIIDEILNNYYGDLEKNNNIIAFNALPILLPNIYQLEIEDILEIRLKAYDELKEMRYYIDNLSSEFSPSHLEPDKINFYLEKKINYSIKQLRRKISGLKINTLQNIVHSFKDPKTYTPMLTTFFADMPAHIALAASMGLVAADTVIEYKKQLNEIKNDPLYFSLKLRNYI